MTKAALAYLDDLEGQELTRKINRVLETVGIAAETDQAVTEASKARLAEIDDNW